MLHFKLQRGIRRLKRLGKLYTPFAEAALRLERVASSIDFPVAHFLEAVFDTTGVNIPGQGLVRALRNKDEDILMLLTQASNFLAKAVPDDYWYSQKNKLLNFALDEKFHGLRYSEGILYAETSEGQVSFHILDDMKPKAYKILGEEDTNPWVRDLHQEDAVYALHRALQHL